MLADYRAKGGRIRQKEPSDPFGSAGPTAASSSQNKVPDKAFRKTDSEEEKTGKQSDTNWTPKVPFVSALSHKALRFLYPVKKSE